MVAAVAVLGVLALLVAAVVVALVAWVRGEENRRSIAAAERRIAELERRAGRGVSPGREPPG